LGERKKKVVVLKLFLPCVRVKQTWEREAVSGPDMAITLLEESRGSGKERQVVDMEWIVHCKRVQRTWGDGSGSGQVVDLIWLLPCGRVQRIWEREAGNGRSLPQRTIQPKSLKNFEYICKVAVNCSKLQITL